jgi:hypothetical protein
VQPLAPKLLGASYIHQLSPTIDMLEDLMLQHPEGIGSPPVVLVAIEDDGGIGIDAFRAEEPLKLFAVDVVANELVVQVVGPIDLDCAGDVAGVVEQQVLVGLDEADPWILEVLGHPIG